MKDFKVAGFKTAAIKALVDGQLLEKVKPGLYRPIDLAAPPEVSLDLVDVSRAIPGGVICLLSALSHYQLTTQNPSKVDVAIRNYQRAPHMLYPPITVYFFRNRFYEPGIETIKTKYAEIKIYNREKSICDAFRYRKKIGEDVCLEALRNYMNSKKRDLVKLGNYADICQVKTIIIPYIKSLAGV